MGVKHAQALLADPESCEHCCALLSRILEHRLRVSAASKADPCHSNTAPKTSDKPAKASACWGYIVDDPEAEFAPLFSQLLYSGDEHGYSKDDDDVFI